MQKIILTILLIGFSFFSFAQAPETLQHSTTSYVNDYAKMFTSEQEHNLDQVMRAFHDTVQITLVTVNSLNNLDPSDYAVKLGNQWGVGSHSNNGLLILICPSEHKFFAATGGGIQGDLTDMDCAAYYRDYAQSKYRDGDFYGGTLAVLNKYIDILSPSAKEFRAKQQAAEAAIHKEEMNKIYLSLFYTFFSLIILGLITYAIILYKRKQTQKLAEFNALKDRFKNIAEVARGYQISFEKSFEYSEALELKKAFFYARLNERMDTDWTVPQYNDYISRYNTFILSYKGTMKTLDNKKAIKAEEERQKVIAEQLKEDTIRKAEKLINKYNDNYYINSKQIITNIVKSLDNMVFEKVDSAGLNTYLLQLLDNIKLAIDNIITAKNTNDVIVIDTAITKLNLAVNAFDSKCNNADETINIDNDKIKIANTGRLNLEKEILFHESYITKPGVSESTAEKTKQQCLALRARLNEFNGINILEMYALYFVLKPLVSECNGAKKEFEVYDAEQKRLAQIEAERLKKISDGEERKRKEEEEEEIRARIRKRKEDEEATAAALIAATIYTTQSNNDSYISSNNSNNSDSGISFGGGSFDGGGGGGGW